MSSAFSRLNRLSVLSAEHADKEGSQFEDPIVDTIKMIHAVKLALQRRHEKRLTYSTCLQEVESKQTQLAKLRAQIGMEAKAYAVEMSLRRAQETAEVAREDFATVSQRVLREVDRFKREKAEDMRRMVLDYIQLQVEYNKRMEQVWASLIPQLERVQLDQNANIVGTNTAADATSSPHHPPVHLLPSNGTTGTGQPHIHNQPMVPNPQQAMQPQHPPSMNPYYGQSQQQHQQYQPQPHQHQPQDPAMLSVQYRTPSTDGL